MCWKYVFLLAADETKPGQLGIVLSSKELYGNKLHEKQYIYDPDLMENVDESVQLWGKCEKVFFRLTPATKTDLFCFLNYVFFQ